jgi:hypothetical protein
VAISVSIMNRMLMLGRKRHRGSTLCDAMKIGPSVVLEEGRQYDGSGVGT